MTTWLMFWMLALTPALVFPFLLFAYARKFGQRKALIRSLLERSSALSKYSRAFGGSEDLDSSEWKRRLDLDIESYVYPTLLCSLFALGGTIMTICRTTDNGLQLPATIAAYAGNVPITAIAAFAGAYTWALFDFVDRFRILNLPTYALHSMWFGMVLAPIIAPLSVNLLQIAALESVAPFVGLGIGMLPTAVIISYVQDTTREKLGLERGEQVPPLWHHLQGLTPDIITRLVEASVTSASHLANQDPVGLLRRTNIEWRNVLDMMDQAFLLVYVGDNLSKLRAMGIRGAIEMALLDERLERETDPAGPAHATVDAIAAALNSTPAVVRNLTHNLWDDPQVRLIRALWYDRAATPDPAGQEPNPVNLQPAA